MTYDEFISKAVGVPFKDRGRDFLGWDCWGLIWCGYRDCPKIDLPCFEDVPSLKNWEAKDLYDLVYRQHIEIKIGNEKIWDVVVFRGLPIHVGLVVKKGLMLHVEEGLSTCIESYYSINWKHKLIGIYRHKELTSNL